MELTGVMSEKSLKYELILGDKLPSTTPYKAQQENENAHLISQSHMVNAWQHAFLPVQAWHGPVRFFSCYFNDELIGYVPFAKQKISFFSINSLAGYYWPFRTLYINNNTLSILEIAKKIGALLAQNPVGSVLRFGPISSSDVALITTLQGLIDAGWNCLSQQSGPVFELPLPTDEATLRKTMSSSLLKNIEYCNRRLHKTVGPVTAVRYDIQGSIELLDTLALIESNSWVAKQAGEVKFIGDKNRKFWTELSQKTSSGLEIVCWILTCNDKPIAFSAHFETATTIYIIANSFDEEWKTHSPGSILTFEVLKDAIARGKSKVDWGQGDSGYKQRWGAAEGASLLDVMLFRPNLLGKTLSLIAKRALPAWQVGMQPK